ncbi:hypothetical protein QZH41_012963, partial [Actinostola sp. cb2023]
KMNELQIRGPGEMDFTSQQNVSETRRRWKRGMEYYLAATCKAKNEAEKVAIFMCMIGRDGQEIKDTFEFEVDEDGSEVVSTTILFNKFEAHCKPRKNLVVDQHRFLTRDQASGESIDQYVTELRTLAAAYEWGELKDDLICSRIVSGVSSRTYRSKCESGKASNRSQHKGNADKPQETKKFTQRQQDNTRAVCGNCGSNHPKGQCPAYGKKCNKCKRLNHYGKMCRSSKNVNSIQQDEDARSGFWQIPVDDESSTLTTFATPYGRYRFTRMPFGIHSAQEVFHKGLHELFQDLSGVETDIDDIILVWGSTREEHDERLEKTLQRARESNLKLNPDKCKIRRTKVLYIGHVFTSDGVKPDVSKLEAITSMPTPEDKHGIQRLLEMVNYVAKFLPNISEVTSPLRELLKKDVAWHWTERHEQSFNDIKKLLTETSTGVLKYYDPKQPVGLQVDACKSGLVAVLMQGGSPIAYASRSLTETECKYAQIEKESLAVVFGCERFHQYIYAKEVRVETDHRPLVSIITKSLDKAPARLQRMLLRLQRYNIDLQYKPGKELYAADTLSRAHLPTTGDEDEDLVLYVHQQTYQLATRS